MGCSCFNSNLEKGETNLDNMSQGDKELNPDFNNLILNTDVLENNLKTSPSIPQNILGKMDSCDSSIVSYIQDQSELIFNYFNELRTNPGNYEKDAEDHGLLELIQKIKNSEPCINLIFNSFFDITLNICINNCNQSENNEDLLKVLENEEKIKNFQKKLFSVEADIKMPNEVIWKLIEINKDIAYDAFFRNNIQYLVVSCTKVPNKEYYKCYFLLLLEKNKL